MKKILHLLLIVGFLVSCSYVTEAQINIGKKLKKAINKKTDEEVDKAIDKGVDEVFDEVFEGSKDDKDAEKQPGEEQKLPDAESAKDEQKPSDQEVEKATSPTLNWARYDFVPGDKVIFEDNLAGEENGEFPSRWDLKQGNVEIAQLGGENVIMFRAGSPGIVPYLKNPEEDYLPEIFTVEFDLYCGAGTFQLFLFDRINQESGSPTGWTSFKMKHDEMGWANNFSELPDKSLPERRWVHIAVAYTNGKLKGYIDETRLVNLPRIDFDPKGVTLYTYIFGTLHEGHYYVKNFRIAEGGVKYYDRFLQDGKIVTNGIRFDVNKTTIKPESMGAINAIYKILNNNPDLKFSVEGHTDSDGDGALNQTLSEGRAEAIMNKLIEMGISADRLSFKGFGESMPIAENSTAEGKANNRRVEFVKM